MPLAANRVVPEQEGDRKGTPAFETHFMTARRHKEGFRLAHLPTLELHLIELGTVLEECKILTRIVTALKIVIDRTEVKNLKIDTVVTELVDPADCLLQSKPGPSTFTQFIRIVLDYPLRR